MVSHDDYAKPMSVSIWLQQYDDNRHIFVITSSSSFVLFAIKLTQGECVMHHVKAEDETIIRARAHQYWEDEGRPEGRDKIHWQRAYDSVTIPHMTPMMASHAEAVSSITDVSLIDGIGSKISAMLEEAGITTLQQISQMSDEDMAELDEKLDLRGRSAREDWIVQAQELIMGQTPRAKIDRNKADDN
jgi:predicted flap endonuclease-1-like 5' DNA nuclease